MQGVAMLYARRNEQLVNPERAAAIERQQGTPAEPTPRYLAARREAEAMLDAFEHIAP